MQSALLSLFITVILFGACSSPDVQDVRPSNTPSVAKAGKFTAGDIAKLEWLRGTYRGTGETQPPFFERYSFEGTTMIVESFEDETLTKVTDTSRYDLSDGEFGHTEGDRRSAASEITDTYVQFVPVKGGGNSYRFERGEGGSWRAVLDFPARGDKPAKQVVYEMKPFPESRPK